MSIFGLSRISHRQQEVRLFSRKILQSGLITSLMLAAQTAVVCQSTPSSTNALPAGSVVKNSGNVPYKQQLVAKCTDFPQQMRWNNSNLTLEDGLLTISGRDNLGRNYLLRENVLPSAGCELWEADLAKRGQKDLLILARGNDSSGGFDSTLTIVSMDENKSLVPWQAMGRFTSTSAGISSLVDDSSKRGANLILETENNSTDNGQVNALDVYRFTPHGVEKANSDINSGTASVATKKRFTPPAHRSASALSAGWTMSGPVKHWVGHSDTTAAVSAAQQLQMNDGAAVPYPAILVIDSLVERRIFMGGEVVGELGKLSSAEHDVRAIGSICEDDEDCRPMVIWVKQ